MIVLGAIIAIIGAIIGNDIVLKVGLALMVIGLLLWIF